MVDTKGQADVISNSIQVNGMLVLIGILGFVTFFAMSIGPIIWVLIAQLFPTRMRGIMPCMDLTRRAPHPKTSGAICSDHYSFSLHDVPDYLQLLIKINIQNQL